MSANVRNPIDTLTADLWRFWHSDNSGEMPREVFAEMILDAGFHFVESVDDDSPASWWAAKYGDVEDAFIEHVNSVKAYNDPAYFASICRMYVEPNPALNILTERLRALDGLIATISSFKAA